MLPYGIATRSALGERTTRPLWLDDESVQTCGWFDLRRAGLLERCSFWLYERKQREILHAGLVDVLLINCCYE